MKNEDVERLVMELRDKQIFWSGVVRGVIGTTAFFAGLVAVIYYVVQITLTLK